MFHLIASLYDVDTIRFTLWGVAHLLHLETGIITTLTHLGYKVYEDWSIAR